MNELDKKIAGILPWKENFGQGMETRGKDGVSWYDLSILYNSLPCESDIAIIVTSHKGHLRWLKATLTNYRLTNAFVILAYDNPFYAWAEKTEEYILKCMPNVYHYLLANAFVMKHNTYDCDKRNGYFWDVRYAQGVIRNFKNIKYVFVVNGDCIFDKPEGVRDVINLLDDADLMSGQSTENLIHTASVIYKVDAFNAIFDYMAEIMRVPVIGSHSPEVMLREAVTELKLKVRHVEKQSLDPKDNTVDMYACYNQDSTWKDLLGFRNLFAEYETAGNNGLEPFDKKYVDDYMNWIFWNGEERETICKYWKTLDRRYLYMFWDRWEESDYNRLYYSCEHYGKEPIFEKE